jgi:predicted kinase
VVVSFGGVPGTGKSTLAEALGRDIGVPVFAMDWMLGSLLNAGIPAGFDVVRVGYGLITTLLIRQLRLGQSAIIDCLPAIDPLTGRDVRESWLRLADEHDARFIVVETFCSDEELHRSRVEGRIRGIPGWREVDWAHVQRMAGLYRDWPAPDLVLDAVDPLEDNLAALKAGVRNSHP